MLVTNLYGSATSSAAQLLIVQPPSITSQPTNQLALPGGSASLEVSAAGTGPLVYQWFFNATNALPGATEAALTLTNVQPEQAGAYTVLVTNLYGSATSSVAQFVIVQPPSITFQSVSQTLPIGSNSVFSVMAIGTGPLSFQWFFNITNALGDATTSALSLTNVQPSQAGLYTVLVTNLAGSISSDAIALRVLVPPVSDASGLLSVAGQASIAFQSIAGLNYTLESTPTLLPAQWTPILPSVSGTGGWMVLSDTNSSIPSDTWFYRIRCE